MIIKEKQLLSRVNHYLKKYAAGDQSKLIFLLSASWKGNLREEAQRFVPAMLVAFRSGNDQLLALSCARKQEMIELAEKAMNEQLFEDARSAGPPLQEAIERLIRYYLGRFRNKFSREISFLPLRLRLKVYSELYRRETDDEAIWHVRDRLIVTLSKLGEMTASQLFALLSFIESYLAGKDASTELLYHFDFIKNAHKERKDILRNRGYQANNALDEISHSLALFLDPTQVIDREAALLTWDILYAFSVLVRESFDTRTVRRYLETGETSLLTEIGEGVRTMGNRYRRLERIGKYELAAVSSFDEEWEERIRSYVTQANATREWSEIMKLLQTLKKQGSKDAQQLIEEFAGRDAFPIDPEYYDRIGRIYEHGNETIKDLKKALEWYLKGVNAGYGPSLRNAGRLLLGDGESPNDLEKGLKLLMQAAVIGESVKCLWAEERNNW